MNVAAQTARRRDSFYLWVAIAAALIVFFGFARTYYLKGVFGTPPLSILLHAHAVLVTLGLCFFLFKLVSWPLIVSTYTVSWVLPRPRGRHSWRSGKTLCLCRHSWHENQAYPYTGRSTG